MGSFHQAQPLLVLILFPRSCRFCLFRFCLCICPQVCQVVPIPGTTKLSHLEENLRACDIVFTSEEVTELEKAVAAIPVVGSRYDALQESKIQK